MNNNTIDLDKTKLTLILCVFRFILCEEDIIPLLVAHMGQLAIRSTTNRSPWSLEWGITVSFSHYLTLRLRI
jgi:hypothetical protein